MYRHVGEPRRIAENGNWRRTDTTYAIISSSPKLGNHKLRWMDQPCYAPINSLR